jgi:aminotransferase
MTRSEPSTSPRKPLNAVIANCPPSGIRRFFDIAQQMENVISLGVGEPDFVTPWRIREAGIWALERGHTTYTSNSGLLALRERICAYLQRRYGAEYDPGSECLITVGVSEGLDLALRVVLNPGDEVLVPEPCYVSYVPCVQFAGGVAIPIKTDACDGFRLHAERVAEAITPRTKALLLGSPANPTGATQSRADLERLVDLANRHDFYLLSDEIYDRLTYRGEHTCLGTLPGAHARTVVLNGFSKAHAMTGWRIGYACAPEPIATLMTRVHQYTMLCASHMAQIAAIEALDNAEADVEEMVADYDRRRRFFVQGLNAIGLDCYEPRGAFYAFPSIARSGLSSEEFAERLLMEERVAVVPGNAFGPSGEGHVRCSYATALPHLEEALERMARFLMRSMATSGLRSAVLGSWFLGLCLLSFPTRADRIVLAPNGDTLSPEGFKTEFAISPNKGLASLDWLQFSTHDGIELEAQRLDLPTEAKKRYAVNIEYPLVPELRGVPAVSLGVRDMLGTGTEHGAFYLASSRSVLLSDRQQRLVRSLRLNAGVGTGRIGGLFFGVETRLASSISIYAERYRRQTNIGVALPLARHVQARAYSLDGDMFYGLSYTWVH